MAAETKAKKRGFRAPHALVIMVILVCITALTLNITSVNVRFLCGLAS